MAVTETTRTSSVELKPDLVVEKQQLSLMLSSPSVHRIQMPQEEVCGKVAPLQPLHPIMDATARCSAILVRPIKHCVHSAHKPVLHSVTDSFLPHKPLAIKKRGITKVAPYVIAQKTRALAALGSE